LVRPSLRSFSSQPDKDSKSSGDIEEKQEAVLEEDGSEMHVPELDPCFYTTLGVDTEANR